MRSRWSRCLRRRTVRLLVGRAVCVCVCACRVTRNATNKEYIEEGGKVRGAVESRSARGQVKTRVNG